MKAYVLIKLNGNCYTTNRVPIALLDQYRQEQCSSGLINAVSVRFRGPRFGKAHTTKANATHFYINY